MLFSAGLIFVDALGAGEIFGTFSYFTLVILISSLLYVRQKAVVLLFVAGLGTLAVLFRFFEFIPQAERFGAWLFILLVIEFVYLIFDLFKDGRT
jgi:hypothetical protein